LIAKSPLTCRRGLGIVPDVIRASTWRTCSKGLLSGHLDSGHLAVGSTKRSSRWQQHQGSTWSRSGVKWEPVEQSPPLKVLFASLAVPSPNQGSQVPGPPATTPALGLAGLRAESTAFVHSGPAAGPASSTSGATGG